MLIVRGGGGEVRVGGAASSNGVNTRLHLSALSRGPLHCAYHSAIRGRPVTSSDWRESQTSKLWNSRFFKGVSRKNARLF